MSKLKIFSVYDSAVGAHMHPMFFQSRGQATRAWLDACVDASTQFAKHPADFTLFEIGTYDEETGQFENLPAKLSLGTALELIATANPSPAIPVPLKLEPSIEDRSAAGSAKRAVERHSERNMQ